MGELSLRCAAVSAEATTSATTSTLAYATEGVGEPVVLVHGFAQNRRCLGPLATALAEQHRTVLLDAPGHGGSARHAGADLRAGAELLVDTAGPGVYLGYSMGGRLCLHAALARPDDVRALILIGATAGIRDDAERAHRRDADDELAAKLERIGLPAFLDEWLALELFADLPNWARFDEERRTNSVAGLAASLRHAGTGSMEPLWDRLPELRCPVLLLSGRRDTRYGELGDAMARGIGPHAHHLTIPDAGHAAHLVAPEATIEVVGSFLSRLD